MTQATHLEINVLNSSIFYHGITRKTIVAFGSLFSDLKIKRENADKTINQTVIVPIAYAPKEKWIVKLEQDPSQDNYTYTTLPRMSFEVTGYSYDASRKMNRQNYITCADSNTPNTMAKTYAPVPYNIDISLYVLTKTQEDALQIVEQIVPFFSPELTMSVKVVPESNIIVDVPVILNSISLQDEYDGDFQTRRFVTHTLNFTLKTHMFGPVSQNGIINRVIVDLEDNSTLDVYTNLNILGNTTTGTSTSTWTDKY